MADPTPASTDAETGLPGKYRRPTKGASTAPARKPSSSKRVTPKPATNDLLTVKELSTEWASVEHLRRARHTPGYLTIRTPNKPIDADAQNALERISGGPDEQARRERQLRALITRLGIATEVAAVTKELNRRRRGEARTRVLAATYHQTLLDLMKGKKPPELEQELKDTDGFIDAILIHQDADTGPLRSFALELIQIVTRRKKIEVGGEFELNLLADQLRARL